VSAARLDAASVRRFLKPEPGSPAMDRVLYGEQLFDVSGDPRERVNRIDTSPEIAADMRRRLADLLAACPGAGGRDGARIPFGEEERARLRALGYAD